MQASASFRAPERHDNPTMKSATTSSFEKRTQLRHAASLPMLLQHRAARLAQLRAVELQTAEIGLALTRVDGVAVTTDVGTAGRPLFRRALHHHAAVLCHG